MAENAASSRLAQIFLSRCCRKIDDLEATPRKWLDCPKHTRRVVLKVSIGSPHLGNGHGNAILEQVIPFLRSGVEGRQTPSWLSTHTIAESIGFCLLTPLRHSGIYKRGLGAQLILQSMVPAKRFRRQHMHGWISGPKPLLTLWCLADHPVSVWKACIKFPLHGQGSEGSKHGQINMRHYVIDHSQGSAEAQSNFTAVGGVAESYEFRLENGKLRYVQTITLQFWKRSWRLSKWSQRGKWRILARIRLEMMCSNIASQCASFSLSFWRISTVLKFRWNFLALWT